MDVIDPWRRLHFVFGSLEEHEVANHNDVGGVPRDTVPAIKELFVGSVFDLKPTKLFVREVLIAKLLVNDVDEIRLDVFLAELGMFVHRVADDVFDFIRGFRQERLKRWV